jgi:uridine kinase
VTAASRDAATGPARAGASDIEVARHRPVVSPARSAVLTAVARTILTPARGRRLAVAIDGVDGAGKTCFADELAALLGQAGHPVVRASIDGFLRPRAERYARGRTSPDGFFLDSHDLEAFQRELLDAFALGGDGWFRRQVFDEVDDRPVATSRELAPPRAILVVDGIFLHRDELHERWDTSVFLDVPTAVSVARCAARDGSDLDPAAPSNRRYVEGQARYLATCDPRARADLVVDNTDLDTPRLVRLDPARTRGHAP